MKQETVSSVIGGLIGTDDFEALAEVFEGYVIFNPHTYKIIDAKVKYEHALTVMRRQDQEVDLAAIECGQIRLATFVL